MSNSTSILMLNDADVRNAQHREHLKPVVNRAKPEPSKIEVLMTINHLPSATNTSISKDNIDRAMAQEISQLFATPPTTKTKTSERRNEQDTPLRFKDSIFIKQNYRYNKIAYQDILYLKADGNYTCVFTTGKTHILKYSLQAFISQLLNDDFIRVHRSYVINTHHILSFNEASALVAGEDIPIGQNYKAAFMQLFIG